MNGRIDKRYVVGFHNLQTAKAVVKGNLKNAVSNGNHQVYVPKCAVGYALWLHQPVEHKLASKYDGLVYWTKRISKAEAYQINRRISNVHYVEA